MQHPRSSGAWTRSLVLAMGFIAAPAAAQRTLGPQVRPFVRTDAAVIALTGVRVIDGTGAPAIAGQTVILRDGLIAWVGDGASAGIPAGAEIIDLAGRTVLPGYVMLHEHMFYPAGQGMYNTLGFSFPRLYLAGGATTIRTGGSMMPYADVNIKRTIDAGQTVAFTLEEPLDRGKAAQAQSSGLQVLRSRSPKNHSNAARPTKRTSAREILRLRFTWSQRQVEAYRPAQSPCRSNTPGGAGRSEAKRRWSTHTKGSEVPVAARVHRKKRSQRGPAVGKVARSTSKSPSQPRPARATAVSMRLR